MIIISCNMLFPSDAVDEQLSKAPTVIQPAVIAAVHNYLKRKNGWQRSIWFVQRQQHISVLEVFTLMGACIFCQAICMTFDVFWHLYSILLPHICIAIIENRECEGKRGREGGNYSPSSYPQ